MMVWRTAKPEVVTTGRRFAGRCGAAVFLFLAAGCLGCSETPGSNAPKSDATVGNRASIDTPAAQNSSLKVGPNKTRPSPPSSLTLELGNDERLELVLIRPGTFLMGSPEDEPGRDEDETLHRVTISRPYYLSKFEITQGQWDAVIGANPSFFTGDTLRPVESVTWERAQEFCRELSKKSGRRVRLPTEAEWEYAARAGTSGPFSCGPELTPEDANFDYSEGLPDAGGSVEETVPVGGFPASAWGLHDMHGNVREWCRDFYAPYPAGPVTDPAGPEEGTYHVLRGGSWDDYSRRCRSAFRHGYRPGDREEANGFRVAVEVEP